MFVRAYLRVSTSKQDPTRQMSQLQAFANERNLGIASFYIEKESGAYMHRPELFRLLDDCQEGDILLVEQVDRLSRLNKDDWQKLKLEISERKVKIVALDLPTSWSLMDGADELTSRLMYAFNAMMLDMLAAFARKDYDDRRRRQAQGIDKAKKAGKYKGRPANKERNESIRKLMEKGVSWSEICSLTGASRSTLSRIKNEA